MSVISQGGESNLSGSFLERTVEREFLSRGVPVFDYGHMGENGDIFTPHYLLRRVPYTSIYGCQSTTEFVYRHFRGGADIRIECKWQQAAGSVDEKFPYMFRNAREAMPEPEIWIVIDGGGARPEAVLWAKREATLIKEKTIRVLSLPEVRQRIKVLVNEALAAA